MKTFDLTIENIKTGYVFNAEQYGNSTKEIEKFWKSRENENEFDTYRLISIAEKKEIT